MARPSPEVISQRTDAESDLPPSSRLLSLLGEHRLTPTQRRIAQCLVEHVDKAPFLSGPELASLAGTSTPSVTRLAVALGYEGYPQFREHLRSLLGNTASREDSARVYANELQYAVAQDMAGLARLVEALADPRELLTAARMLAGSPTLVVLGLRVSAALASSFAYFARKVHPDVRLITRGGSYLDDQIDQACDAGATALVAFVMPRWPRETVSAIERAHERGLSVVAITNQALSPVDDVCDVVLSADVGSRLVFDSQCGPLSLSMVLLQAMCDALPAGVVQERLEAFEQTAAARRIFVS